MKPAGHTAVMADRARGEVAADDAQQALWRKLEYFPTPPWAARAGGELINAIDPHPGRAAVADPSGSADPTRPAAGTSWWCWEPACGAGHMAHGLRDYFATVYATDIHPHEGPAGLRSGPPLDFLSPAADVVDGADWIVTNPPFGLAAEFVAAGLRRAKRGVAILARTTFLEAASRFHLFFGGSSLGRGRPPSGTGRPDAAWPGPDCDAGGARLYAFAPFFERVPMVLGRWDPKASTATAYAWFVWMKPGAAADMSFHTRRLVGLRPEVWPIPPGTRERLTRPEDARVWGARGDAPLFEDSHG